MEVTITIKNPTAAILALLGGVEHPEPVVIIDDAEEEAAPPPSVDAKGFPWDERIHSSSKAINKDGTWRYRKGIDETMIDMIEAELQMDALTEEVVEEQLPPMTFPELMKKITAAKVSPADVQAAVKSVGLNAIPEMTRRPDLIPQVAAALGLS